MQITTHKKLQVHQDDLALSTITVADVLEVSAQHGLACCSHIRTLHDSTDTQGLNVRFCVQGLNFSFCVQGLNSRFWIVTERRSGSHRGQTCAREAGSQRRQAGPGWSGCPGTGGSLWLGGVAGRAPLHLMKWWQGALHLHRHASVVLLPLQLTII